MIPLNVPRIMCFNKEKIKFIHLFNVHLTNLSALGGNELEIMLSGQ